MSKSPRAPVDPEVAEWRRKYPRFPGVAKCVELMWLPRTRGGRREVIHAELVAHASEHLDEMIALYRTYTQQHERLTVLAAIEDARSPAAKPFLKDVSASGCEVERFYANRALQTLGASGGKPDMKLPTLDRLWGLTGHDRLHHRDSWNTVLDPLGLILLRDVEPIPYPPFPRNAVAFATTGGDSVHYGLLDVGTGYNDDSPVVMTVPCSQIGNFIVGASLHEFLAVGVRTGYFSLEQLAYDRMGFIEVLDGKRETDCTCRDHDLMQRLVGAFGLTPWPDHDRRLTELGELYSDLVQARDYD